MRVVAVIPAYNEAGKVGKTVEALLGTGVVDTIRVVDDCSEDETADEAAAAGAEVLRLPINLGKGGAVNRAIEGTVSYDVILLIDADVAETASEAVKLLQPVKEGTADMTIAVLPRKEGAGGFGLVLKLSRWLIKRRTGFLALAPLSGQRALNREAVLAAFPFATDYGLETALTIDVLKAGLKVTEVPAAFTHNYTYRDIGGFRHRGRQFLDVLRLVLRKED